MARTGTQVVAVAALLVAVVGGGYAAQQLIHSDAAPAGKRSTILCPTNALGWPGHVAGPRPVATQPVKEAAVARMVNAYRRANGRQPLVVSRVLSDAARAHSRAMVSGHFFAHDDPAGRSFTQRLARYTPQSCVAENIAWGSGSYGTASGIVTAWKNSAGHRRVMLLPWVKRMGVGTVGGTYMGASGATVVTADFSG